MQSTRVASHAGSWYTNVPQTLAQQLTAWLQGVELTENKAKAVIAPHAGYSYSGPTAAWAYRHFDGNSSPRVVLLGPSHHAYIEGCALPWAGTYDTPLGAIPVDQETVAELQSSGAFQTLSKEEEEDEHSLEMQLPYIRHVFAGKAITLVPIMVGQLSPELEERYARILKPLFEDENTVFVVSSDFCHWGARFRHTPYDPSKGAIWQSIESTDRQGMSLIEQGDPAAFRAYLRNPICVLLATIRAARGSVRTRFVRYDQSEHVTSQKGSSVSYAAAVVTQVQSS